MAYSKPDKQEIFDRAAKVRRALEGHKLILAYKAWLKMPYPEQIRINAEWEKYYADVKTSPIYALFQEQKTAMRSRNLARVKELAEQARLMRENGHNTTLVKPKHPDPKEFVFHPIVIAYKNAEKIINESKDDLENIY